MVADPVSAEEKDVEGAAEAPPFAEQFAAEARSGLNVIEATIFVIGATTAVLAWILGDLTLMWGWMTGWLVGQANVALLRRLLYRVFAGGLGGRLSTVALALKMLVLLAVAFALLSFLPIEPLGFVGGFTATVIGLVAGSMIVAARLPQEPPSGGVDEEAARGEVGSAAPPEEVVLVEDLPESGDKGAPGVS